MFTFLDSFSYCCSGNLFQLDTNTQVSNPGSGMQCGEVTLSGPCSLISMANLHRQFIIIILLMKLEFHCLQIRSQHFKKKKKVKGGKSMQTPFLPLLIPCSLCSAPAMGQLLPWGEGSGGSGGPRTQQQLPSTVQCAQSHPADHCCTRRAQAA